MGVTTLWRLVASSRVSFTWNISATLSPGGQAYTTLARSLRAPYPKHRCGRQVSAWTLLPGRLECCGTVFGPEPDRRYTARHIDTKPRCPAYTLGERHAAAEVPGQNTASLWVQPVTTINTLDPYLNCLAGTGY